MLGENGEHSCQAGIPTYPLDQEDEFGEEEEEEPPIGVAPNGWFIVEKPTKMDDLGGTPISGNLHMFFPEILGFDDHPN